ncbi:MAG: alpha/beta hydrolase [Gammaproteobacteria bacterium]|nr:alpha/beta hydrolase [Gammaproteobacteria bacterium]
MYIYEQGPDHGTPVMFLHGALVAGWMWFGQVEALASYRCLIPDYPGIGHSAGEQWISCADTADKIASIIRSRCDAGSCHIVGLSLGGIIGLHLAQRHADVVRSLIISGVPHGHIALPLRLLNKAMLALYKYPWGAYVIAQVMAIPAGESREAFVDTARQSKPGVWQSVSNEIYNSTLPAGLETISLPTLVVAGTRDSAPARRAVPYLCQQLANATGCIVPDVGHQWNAEQPELFTEMVRQWLASQRVADGLVRVDGDF